MGSVGEYVIEGCDFSLMFHGERSVKNKNRLEKQALDAGDGSVKKAVKHKTAAGAPSEAQRRKAQKKALVGQEAAAVLGAAALEADRRGLSWSLDPTAPAQARIFRVTVEGEDTPMVVRLSDDGTWSLAT